MDLSQIDSDTLFGIDRLTLLFQPIADSEQQITGMEALLCPHQPELFSPLELVQRAEATGEIIPIGQWVLETACQQLAAWQSDPATAHWKLGVNVSGVQLRDGNFDQVVEKALKASGARPEGLRLELTESVRLLDIDQQLIQQLERIRAMGVSLALDDVGTGFSSMCQIKTLPLDCLKIDRTFVQDLPDCLTSQCIVRALLDLADGLGLEVVAEGVETTAQFEYLRDVGCRAFQGYLFGRPAPWPPVS